MAVCELALGEAAAAFQIALPPEECDEPFIGGCGGVTCARAGMALPYEAVGAFGARTVPPATAAFPFAASVVVLVDVTPDRSALAGSPPFTNRCCAGS